MTPLHKARLSAMACFFAFGGFLSTWVSRIPTIEHRLGLNSAQLGIALLGSPVGQVLAMRLIPDLVHRWSSATTCRCAAVATGACVILIGLADGLLSLTVILALFGVALGTLDISMNTQGVAVERRYGRPILSGLHGTYCVGVLAGASLGALAAGLGVKPLPHFIVAAGLFTLVSLFGARWLLGSAADSAVDVPAEPAAGPRGLRLREHPLLIAVGVVAFCSCFAEGAVDNWSAVYLHQARHSCVRNRGARYSDVRVRNGRRPLFRGPRHRAVGPGSNASVGVGPL